MTDSINAPAATVGTDVIRPTGPFPGPQGG